MFEDVKLVVFCVALTDYDELTEDSAGLTRNKMLQSRSLFESIVAHPSFEQMDFLLVLTKYDLLEKRIDQAPLTVCDWFSDFNPVVGRHRTSTTGNSRHGSNGSTLAQTAFHYIAIKFKQVFSALTRRKLYVTACSGLDSESTDQALRYAREVLKWEEERHMFGAGDDFESFSSETSSSPWRSLSLNLSRSLRVCMLLFLQFLLLLVILKVSPRWKREERSRQVRSELRRALLVRSCLRRRPWPLLPGESAANGFLWVRHYWACFSALGCHTGQLWSPDPPSCRLLKSWAPAPPWYPNVNRSPNHVFYLMRSELSYSNLWHARPSEGVPAETESSGQSHGVDFETESADLVRV